MRWRLWSGPDTVVLTLQNGIDNGDQLAQALGTSLVMIGSAYMEGRIKEPGVVTQGGPGTTTLRRDATGLDRTRSTATPSL